MKSREALPYTGRSQPVVLPSAYRFGPFRFDAAAYRLLVRRPTRAAVAEGDGPSAVAGVAPVGARHQGRHPSRAVARCCGDRQRRHAGGVGASAGARRRPLVTELRADRAATRLSIHRRRAGVVGRLASGKSRTRPAARPRQARHRRLGLSERHRRCQRQLDGGRALPRRSPTICERCQTCASSIARACRSRRGARSIEAARACGLDLLVVGSYQRAGDRLRITARAIHAGSGEAVAHSKADGAVADVFQLQDAIVTQLLRSLHVPVTAAAAARIGVHETSSLEAYRALTEGRLKLETLNPADVPEAIRDFERAIALDPRYAHAYVGLAHAHLWRFEASRARNRPDTGELRAAISHGRRAVELDPGLGEAHAALAFLLASAGRQSEAHRGGTDGGCARAERMAAPLPAGRRGLGQRAARRASTMWFACFRSSRTRISARRWCTWRGRISPGAEEILRQGLAVQQRGSSKADRFPANGLHWLLGLVRLARGRRRSGARGVRS